MKIDHTAEITNTACSGCIACVSVTGHNKPGWSNAIRNRHRRLRSTRSPQLLPWSIRTSPHASLKGTRQTHVKIYASVWLPLTEPCKETKQFNRCNDLVWHVSLICIAFVMMSAWQRLPCCAHHFDDWSSNHSLALHSVQLTQNPDREKLALRRNVYKCASNRDTEMQLPCVDMRRWMHVNNKYDAYVYNQARNPQYMCITPWHICLAKQMTEIKTWWTKPYEIDFQTRALHKRHCIGTNYRRKQQLHRQQTPHEG